MAAVGAISDSKISFEDWLKETGNDTKVKPQQARVGNTENGVPFAIATKLSAGDSIFNFVSQNPTKETSGAGGASVSGVGNQNSGVNDGGANTVDSVVGSDNNNTVLAASASGHSVQSQGPTLASGLQAATGNDNTGAQGGATSDQLNKDLYAQYEAAMHEARVADNPEGVSNGEGTLSTGDTTGANGTGGVNGTNGTNGTAGADGTNSTDPTNTGGAEANGETGNAENSNDTSNSGTNDINKQEEKHQEEILDTKRFKRMTEDEAA